MIPDISKSQARGFDLYPPYRERDLDMYRHAPTQYTCKLQPDYDHPSGSMTATYLIIIITC